MKNYRYLMLLVCLMIIGGNTAYGRTYRRTKMGYDADVRTYFERQRVIDNSIQLAFDAGFNRFSAKPIDVQDFRTTTPLDPSAYQYYFGFMAEKSFLSSYFSLSAGLYFTQLNTYFFGGPTGTGEVLIKDYEDASRVNYTSVSNVKTATSYLGIPIMARFEPINEIAFGLFLRATVMANIALQTSSDFVAKFSDNKIDDLTPEQQAAKNRIKDLVRNDGIFFSQAQLSIGLRLGHYEDCNVRIEGGMPIALTGRLAMLQLKTGFALRLTVAIPFSSLVN